MSDFREAMWGVVQQAIAELDFDFAGYAAEHFDAAGGNGRRAALRGGDDAAAARLLLVVLGAMRAAAAATSTAEQELAARYAAVVALKHQDEACDTSGEPFRPLPADVVLGQADVSLRDSSGKVVKTAPTASDLFAAAPGDYLDLPGDPLHPGCSYEAWAKQIGAGKPTTSYAHIVTEPGKPGS